MTETVGLQRELEVKIKECNDLYGKLRERPFEIKASAQTVDTSNHPVLTNIITEKLKNKERFSAKVKIEDQELWCIVVGRKDSHNANFDDSEEGQIFVGILDNEPLNKNLSFNDQIVFQSCDVLNLK